MIIRDNKIYLDGTEDTLIACLIQAGVRIDKNAFDAKKSVVKLTMDTEKETYQVECPQASEVVCYLLLHLYKKTNGV